MATLATQDSNSKECERQVGRTNEAWPKRRKAGAYRYRLATLALDSITRLREIAFVTSASPTHHWIIGLIHPDVPPATSATQPPSIIERVHDDVDAEEAGLRLP
uniref:Uncharacterized protein n=1 Tax=Trichogramma kaykai TaxID=54128 RepID=A0ABD2WEV6_9HYME